MGFEPEVGNEGALPDMKLVRQIVFVLLLSLMAMLSFDEKIFSRTKSYSNPKNPKLYGLCMDFKIVTFFKIIRSYRLLKYWLQQKLERTSHHGLHNQLTMPMVNKTPDPMQTTRVTVNQYSINNK